MSADNKDILRLLDHMRSEFLRELPERCDRIESCVLALDEPTDANEAFEALYREVHSLKGAGGTHGLSIITNLCHQFENLLGSADAESDFYAISINHALAYIDLLRDAQSAALSASPDFRGIEAAAEALRSDLMQHSKAVLVVESSLALAALYKQLIEDDPIQVTLIHDGLIALECLLHTPFDLLVVGRELRTLNGIALISALRATKGFNCNVPVIMISSDSKSIPNNLGLSAIVRRDVRQSEALVKAIRHALHH